MAIEIDAMKVNAHYEALKSYIRSWMLSDYIPSLKRLNRRQENELFLYAQNISFDSIWNMNNYVQTLPTVGKRKKQELDHFVRSIQWLPQDCPIGVLDGAIVTNLNPAIFYGTRMLEANMEAQKINA